MLGGGTGRRENLVKQGERLIEGALSSTLPGRREYLRPLTPDDAVQRSQFLMRNAQFLKPFMPSADPQSYTAERQYEILVQFASELDRKMRYPWGIFSGDSDQLIGWVNLSDVVRGAFHSAHLGYVMDAGWTRRGIMTDAVAAAVHMGFSVAHLHRIQAAIMPGNAASIGVITRNDFEFIGRAPSYLRIDGTWQDHDLFARINPQW